jgi:phospholipid/cholesterol/gamma-HCH transport system ATP-binding protein
MNLPANSQPVAKTGVRIEVRNLSRSFGDKQVLKRVSLEVEPGEIFMLMGPSGSGKSVLLRHVIGLEKPDEGEILLDGEPVESDGVMDRHRIAMVFQSGALFNSLTVAENVGFYLAEHRLKPPAEIARVVRRQLEMVGLTDVEEKFPAELSGGMKKRVAIARALVIEPELVLFDEPTSELDPISSVNIAEAIVAQNERIGATSLVVTHDRDLVFCAADRVAVIHEGGIIFVGTPDELRASTDSFIKQLINPERRLTRRGAAPTPDPRP